MDFCLEKINPHVNITVSFYKADFASLQFAQVCLSDAEQTKINNTNKTAHRYNTTAGGNSQNIMAVERTFIPTACQ